MIKKVISVLCVITLISSCKKTLQTKRFNFGTENDSALYYYNKGWEHIMDYGEWTLSEEAYRKAITFDPNFILGKGIVGKITTNLEERKAILIELETEKNEASDDEHLILDDLLSILELMNARDQGIKLSPEFYTNFYSSAEKDMRTFIQKYPHESYIKAEYIEILHANHGAQTALDSIIALTTPMQKTIPFYISYAATLETELGNFNNALDKTRQLELVIDNPNAPAIYYIYAQIYLAMDSLELAKSNIEKAIQLDTKHQLAYRVQKVIDQKILERKTDSINYVDFM